MIMVIKVTTTTLIIVVASITFLRPSVLNTPSSNPYHHRFEFET